MSYRDRGERGDRGDRHGGAGHLARLHGTSADRVNCPFYLKMGACRHGDKCNRRHEKPAFSPTILIAHMWDNPLARQLAEGQSDRDAKIPRHQSDKRDPDFEEFYIDLYEELSKCGEIEDIAVCDNVVEHLLGNVYVRFYDEADADKALKAVSGRFFGGKQLAAEFSPVTDFGMSRCRQYDREQCDRGHCNYHHCKRVDATLKRDLDRDQPYKGQRSAAFDRRR